MYPSKNAAGGVMILQSSYIFFYSMKVSKFMFSSNSNSRQLQKCDLLLCFMISSETMLWRHDGTSSINAQCILWVTHSPESEKPKYRKQQSKHSKHCTQFHLLTSSYQRKCLLQKNVVLANYLTTFKGNHLRICRNSAISSISGE